MGRYKSVEQIKVLVVDGQCYMEFKETEDIAEFEIIDNEKRKEIRSNNE